MKRTIILFILAVFALSGNAQTVENIRVTQEGDQLKITYRIGASTESQLYNVYLSCSMDGGSRFEPEAVIGDVGENVVGGKSYYMVMWDVFEDVDEVINPNITVRVELVSDANGAAATATRTPTEPANKVQEEPREVRQETVDNTPVSSEPKAVTRNLFERNGFFSYSGMRGFGIPVGISFGSLNNWGYYVTPMRLGIDVYDFVYPDWDGTYVNDTEFDFHYMLSAGVTKYFVSAGFYRLHGYWGVGVHSRGQYMKALYYDPVFNAHTLLETGVVNVIGGFNVTLGFAYSIGYPYPFNLTFGAGFVF